MRFWISALLLVSTTALAHWSGSCPRLLGPEQAWVHASQFDSTTNHAILEQVLEEVRASVSRGERPMVAFDLDETALDNRLLMEAIVRGPEGWIDSPESSSFSAEKKIIRSLPLSKMGTPEEIFRNAGLAQSSAAFRSFEAHFKKLFFSNRVLGKYPLAFPGFVKFVKKLHEAGAWIVYLSGRNEATQGEATRQELESLELPLDERGIVVLKERKIPTEQFKLEKVEELKKHGRWIAYFDNEPLNLITVREKFPEMMAILFLSYFDKVPKSPAHGMFLLTSWE